MNDKNNKKSITIQAVPLNCYALKLNISILFYSNPKLLMQELFKTASFHWDFIVLTPNKK